MTVLDSESSAVRLHQHSRLR